MAAVPGALIRPAVRTMLPVCGPAGPVDQGGRDLDLPGRDVGLDADLVDDQRGAGRQGDPADDAVPVGLGVIRDAVGVFADIDVLDPVVHTDDHPVRARLGESGQVVFVRRAQAVGRAGFLAVDPEAGFPVAALQAQDDAAAPPGLGDREFPLVPGRPDVVLDRVEPERDLDVARHPVGRVLRGGEPGLVDDAAGPLGLDRNIVAQAVLGQRTGQTHDLDLIFGQGFLEPAFGNTLVVRVEAHHPSPRQIDRTLRGGQLRPLAHGLAARGRHHPLGGDGR